MNIVDLCKIKYPGMVESWNIMFGQDSQNSPIRIIKWDVPNTPEPTTEELEAEIPQYQRQFDVETFKSDIDRKVNNLLLSTAQTRGYSSVNSIISYVASGNIQWKAEADAFVAWRDQVWEHVYIEYINIDAGGEIPNEDVFMATLPQIVWPGA
jgi:uncharacterized protein (UPF0297 family)